MARFASRNPNLQNIPARDEELGPLVRGLFLPEPGEEWCMHDLSQMEYRLLAHYAVGPGSAEFRQRYRDDPRTDYHKFCAEMLGVDPEDQVRRKRVKNTNFAKGYGAMAPKLAQTFGCTVDEAKAFILEYERALPFTVKTFEHIQRKASQRGYVFSLLRRRARFPLWEPADNSRRPMAQRKRALPRESALKEYGPNLVRASTYTAMNRVMQFGNADYIKKAMVEIWEAGLNAPDALGAMLLTVHDELDHSVPPTPRAAEAIAEVKRIMETTIELRVPVMVSEKRGPSWGACE